MGHAALGVREARGQKAKPGCGEGRWRGEEEGRRVGGVSLAFCLGEASFWSWCKLGQSVVLHLEWVPFGARLFCVEVLGTGLYLGGY